MPNKSKKLTLREEILDNRARLIKHEKEIVAAADLFFVGLEREWKKEINRTIRTASPNRSVSATQEALLRRKVMILRRVNAITDKKVAEVQKWLGTRVQQIGLRESVRVQSILDTQISRSLVTTGRTVPNAGFTNVKFQGIGRGSIQSALGSDLVGHKQLKSFEHISKTVKEKMKKELAQTIADGKGPDDLIKKWTRGSGSAHRKFKNDVRALARTSLHAASNAAHEAVYRQNAVLIPRVRWEATFDSVTCMVCGGYHGTEYAVNNAPAIPAHLNCRCILIPIFGDPLLNSDLNSLEAYVDKGVTRYRQADRSFDNWLRVRATEAQKNDFFQSKFKRAAWQDKKVKLEQMVTPTNHVLTDGQISRLITDSNWLKAHPI